MLARYWKKIGLFILIVACVFNVMGKIMTKVSLDNELNATVEYTNNLEENKSGNI